MSLPGATVKKSNSSAKCQSIPKSNRVLISRKLSFLGSKQLEIQKTDLSFCAQKMCKRIMTEMLH